MIVYNDTKKQFVDNVRCNVIADKILTLVRERGINAGRDDRDNVVIVELKQWQKAEKVDDSMHYSVRTYVGNSNRIVCHPSYQAYSYARFISNYSEDTAPFFIKHP